MQVRQKTFETFKRFGQNFLKQIPTTIERIIEAFSTPETDRILEIGPGRVRLPRKLTFGDDLTTVEIDTEQLNFLKKNPRHWKLLKDFLKMDIAAVAGDSQLRKNRKYSLNITTPIIFKLLEERDRLGISC
ncbi:MAG: hypothetical protein IPG53_22005 [Ignavibacteriales bacterium]|nr:hypothetical protein [Ignavibacteriales bacterium]